MHHVAGEHSWAMGQCLHGNLSNLDRDARKEQLKFGSPRHKKLGEIVMVREAFSQKPAHGHKVQLSHKIILLICFILPCKSRLMPSTLINVGILYRFLYNLGWGWHVINFQFQFLPMPVV